jgi:hypothetical protein
MGGSNVEAYDAAKIGNLGKSLFRNYMDGVRNPYLWVDQRRETMPVYLRRLVENADYSGKRPDAIIPIGDDVVLVDVKNRKAYNDASGDAYFTLDKKDAERLLQTEHALGKGILLVYRDNASKQNAWYACYFSEAMQAKKPVQRKDGTGQYYKIRREEFRPLEDYLNGVVTTEGAQRRLFN